MEDTTVSLAHRYASEAEALEDRYMWEQAIDLHLQAAEHFMLAVNDTHSPEVIQTLKLMHANHTRQAKDLRRRLAKVQAASAAAASKSSPKESETGRPSSSSGSSPRRSSSTSVGAAASPSTSSRSTEDSNGLHHDRKRHQSLKQQRTVDGLTVAEGGSSSHRHRSLSMDERRRSDGHGVYGEDHSDESGDEGTSRQHGEGHSHHHYHHHHHASGHSHQNHHEPLSSTTFGSTHASSNLSSTSSSATVEDSFTMIKTMRDDSDPFNKFWEAVENLVQKISSPVAFATIPLDSDEPTPPPAANLTNQQQQQPSQPEKPVPFVSSQLQTPAQTWGDAPFAVAAEGPKQPSSSSASKVHSQEPPCHQQQPPRQENLMLPQQKRHVTTSKRESDLESDMVDSYFIIDSPSAPVRNATLRSRSGSANTSADTSQSVGENSQRSRKTIEEYQIENQQLKQALDRLSKRNQELEKSAQAAMQLKTNMNTWKQEVERRAMQLKQSQDMLRSVTMGRHTGQIRSADSSALLLKRPQESHTPPLLEPQTGAARQGEMPEAPTTGLGGANGGSVANTLGESNSGSAGSTQPTAYELANPMTMQRRLMELTSELEALKLENTRQTALMRKYKQRWEDLKEAAKRRRSGVKTEEGLGSESPSHKHANGNPGRAIYEENLSNQPQGPHSSTSNSRRHPPPQSVGSPFPNTVMMASSVPRGPQHSGGSPSSPLRPPTGLARSSSASGPNLHPGGTYQRRIIMETNKGGLALEHMNTYRNNHAPLSTRSPSAGKGRAHGQGQEHGLPPTVIAATAISPSASAKPKDPSL